MTKTQAVELIEFIDNHFDMVSQDEWFDFCTMVLDAVVSDANKGRFAKDLIERFPWWFDEKEE